MYASLGCSTLSVKCTAGPNAPVFFVCLDVTLDSAETPLAKTPFSWFLNKNMCRAGRCSYTLLGSHVLLWATSVLFSHVLQLGALKADNSSRELLENTSGKPIRNHEVHVNFSVLFPFVGFSASRFRCAVLRRQGKNGESSCLSFLSTLHGSVAATLSHVGPQLGHKALHRTCLTLC